MDGTFPVGLIDLRPEAPIVVAHALHLKRDMTLKDAFRAALVECRAHVVGNIAPVMDSRDAEALHQLRVGLRRLHIALASFGQTRSTEALRTRAKAFFDATGPARDLDVFLTELFEPVVMELGPQEGFAILRARAELARARAWDGAVAQIGAPAFADFLDELSAVTERLPKNAAITVYRHAPAVLDKHLSRVTKRGRGLKTMSHDGTHRLRIALKKLRYAAEFHASLYKQEPAQRYLKQLKTLQDLLGLVNDAVQVRAALGHLLLEEAASASVQADLSFAAGLINGWHRASAGRLTQKALRRWRRFKHTEPFWA
jgi:CHAD domain-containing protein